MSRYSKLAPLTLMQRQELILHAVKFFSPRNYQENCKIIDKTPDGNIEPFCSNQFLKYLKKINFFEDPYQYTVVIQKFLFHLSRSGILLDVGPNQKSLIDRTYLFLKEFTDLEVKSSIWLSEALGADFIYNAFKQLTFQIVGTNEHSDEQAGTGVAIAKNLILTCAHVLKDMKVCDKQNFLGTEYKVKRQLSHSTIDVGLLEIEPHISYGPLSYPPMLAFRDPEICETIYTIGYPKTPLSRAPVLNMQKGEVTNIDFVDVHNKKHFLYSAISRPGNSGGPIVSSTGHIVGIVTEDIRDTSDNLTAPFYAGVRTSDIAKALTELVPNVTIPIENYD